MDGWVNGILIGVWNGCLFEGMNERMDGWVEMEILIH